MEGQWADTLFFSPEMFLFLPGVGREMMTLEIFLYSLIYILRDHMVFQETCSIFSIVKAPTCHSVLQGKKIHATSNLKNTF